MVQALTGFPQARVPRFSRPQVASRTEQIRNLLRDQGPLSATVVARELDLASSALVGALLKADMHAGRAFHRDGRYHWNHGHDEVLAREISAAVKLLTKNGYRVERIST